MSPLFNTLSMYQNTLFILGNGFDISHGIKSRYSDFKQWVSAQGDQRLIGLMDIFFSNKRDLWSDIEKALGEYDEEAILEFCRPDEEIDYDHMMRSVAAIEDAPDWIFKPILDQFVEYFFAWVESIDISQAKPQFSFSPIAQYLTFNYTDTLESVYNIPSSQITHIHGSRINKNGEYIMGHNDWRDPNKHDTLSGEFYFEQDTKNKIIRWMNRMKKDTARIINEHAPFFIGLSSIDTVIVRGHSLDKVDWPYFEEIAQRVAPTAQWTFHHHTPEDVEHIQEFTAHVGLKSYALV